MTSSSETTPRVARRDTLALALGAALTGWLPACAWSGPGVAQHPEDTLAESVEAWACHSRTTDELVFQTGFGARGLVDDGVAFSVSCERGSAERLRHCRVSSIGDAVELAGECSGPERTVAVVPRQDRPGWARVVTAEAIAGCRDDEDFRDHRCRYVVATAIDRAARYAESIHRPLSEDVLERARARAAQQRPRLVDARATAGRVFVRLARRAGGSGATAR